MGKLASLGLIALCLLASSFTEDGSWVIDATSSLAIHGSTNVNSFTCKTRSYTGADTLHFVTNYTACELQFAHNRMAIAVDDFDCGARQISKDFRKTLKSDRYPQLYIRFRSLKTTAMKNNTYVFGVADITLAGVTRCFTIRYKVELKDKNTVFLRGAHRVNFADFNLTAPERLNGLVKVREALEVEFNLVLKDA